MKPFRTLGNSDVETISVPLPTDEDGFLDRACPSAKCKTQFKVLADDWKEKVKDEAVFCPMCRHEADSSEWLTKAQHSHLMEHAKAKAMDYAHKALGQIAREFNSGWSRNSMIKLSMKVDRPPRAMIWPLRAAKIMEQRYTCEACGCRYATVGASFFCVACGHNSVLQTFSESLSTQRHTIENGVAVREALEKQCGKDAATSAWRYIVEQGLTNVVSVFEHYTEAKFKGLPNVPATRRGAFQRLDDAAALWRQVGLKGYDEILTAGEFRELTLLVQRRHLITHRNGIVDAEYRNRTGDTTWEEGQRITVTERDVLHLIGHVQKIAKALTAGPVVNSSP